MLHKKTCRKVLGGYVFDDTAPLTIQEQHERVLKMSDNVNNPKHYKRNGLECITYSRHLTFSIGNAFKYIWRAGQKHNHLEDLKKAEWYLIDAITYLELNPEPEDGFTTEAITEAFEPEVATILIQLLEGYYTAALVGVQTLIKNMENGDANS